MVPTSVTRLSSVTGTTSSSLPVDLQRDVERPELLEVVAPVLDQRAGAIALADRRAQEPELRRLADHQAELTIGNRQRWLPSSIPNGTTQSALSGAGSPGTAGIALSMPT